MVRSVKRVRGRALVAALVLSLPATAASQTEKQPAFDVASIRSGAPGTPTSLRVTPGRLDLVNTPLRSLVAMAFRIENASQLSGPDWLNTVRFDIQATMPAGIGREKIPEMLQTLLAERFGLVARVEQRPVDGFELVVGAEGLKIREVAAVDDLAKDFGGGNSIDRVSETLDGPVRLMMVPLGLRTVTATSLYSTATAAGGAVQVDAARITMAEFARILASNVDQPVADKTALKGVYEFKAVLGSNQSAIRGLQRIGITTTVQGNPIGEPTGVSTHRAVENLGLKLEARRVPIDHVIIEKIERTATAN